MKKIFLIIIVLSTSISYSQIIEDFGLKLGGSISNLDWDYKPSFGIADFEADNKFGINFGVFAESMDILFFRVVAEINYIQKGTKKDIPYTTMEQPDGTGETLLWEIGLDYLNFSVLLKPIINLEIIKPYLLIGPRIDFEVSQSIKRDNPKFYDEFSNNNIGLKLGIGSEFKLIKMRFLAEIIYDSDYNELFKNENVKINSRSYDFRIGVLF